jgi:DNA repair photolyase
MSNRRITHHQAKSILTKASGFVDAYDYTLNPYSGCAFGCSYCYAAFFASNEQRFADWGYWVEVKDNALELLRKKRKKPLTDKTIYMSTVTDPYQPIEKQLGLTRAILEELVEYHQPRLVLQTRGTLITRDVDVLKRFDHVQVNMTITTDDEAIRKVFEPMCPSNSQRLQTISQLNAEEINTCITMTPLLPLESPEDFANALLSTGVKKFVVQRFHLGKTRFAAGTGDKARQLANELDWDEAAYRKSVQILRSFLPHLGEGQAGFAPDW